jgi:hypothetical protein
MSKSNKHDFGDSFLYADDLVRDGKWIQATLTIKGVVPPNAIVGDNGKTIDKVCLTFEKTPKILALCTTNERLCRLNCGSGQSENWVGKSLTIYPSLIDAFGEKDVPCIRVRLPKTIPVPFGTRKHMGRDITNQPITQ